MLAAAPLALSASPAIRAAAFARSCQSVHLLGRVVTHLNDHRLPLDFRFDEALQLHRTGQALASLLPTEADDDDPLVKPTLCSAMALVYSALLILYDTYACSHRMPENAPETQPVMSGAAITGLKVVREQALALGRRTRVFVESIGLGIVSPLILNALYEAAATCEFKSSSCPGSELNKA